MRQKIKARQIILGMCYTSLQKGVGNTKYKTDRQTNTNVLYQITIAVSRSCEFSSLVFLNKDYLYLFISLTPPIFFILKMLSDFYVCCIYSNALRLLLNMAANAMIQNQKAPLEAV